MSAPDEDLNPTETEGYKAPEKVSLDKLKELDQDDAALSKWKDNLLKGVVKSKYSTHPFN